MEATKMPIHRGLYKVYVVHIYNGILLGHKKERMPFATDLEIIIRSEVSQKENDICYHMYNLQIMVQMNLFTNQKYLFKWLNQKERGRGGRERKERKFAHVKF